MTQHICEACCTSFDATAAHNSCPNCGTKTWYDEWDEDGFDIIDRIDDLLEEDWPGEFDDYEEDYEYEDRLREQEDLREPSQW